jgi:hypothetical protein
MRGRVIDEDDTGRLSSSSARGIAQLIARKTVQKSLRNLRSDGSQRILVDLKRNTGPMDEAFLAQTGEGAA